MLRPSKFGRVWSRSTTSVGADCWRKNAGVLCASAVVLVHISLLWHVLAQWLFEHSVQFTKTVSWQKRKVLRCKQACKAAGLWDSKSDYCGVTWKNDDPFERHNDFLVANSNHWTSGREMLVPYPGETSNHNSETSFWNRSRFSLQIYYRNATFIEITDFQL